jgi:hypothetical protein
LALIDLLTRHKAAAALAIVVLTGCAVTPRAEDPQTAFMARLNALCGQAFAGRVVASEPAGADNDMAGERLVMHVRRCSPGRIEIPFHVGNDRRRTWVITRTGSGLRLKHDHRHEDGSPDTVTMYGGDTANAGTAQRQAFPVDAQSVAMFRANQLDRSVTNVWAMEVTERSFTYELARPPGPTARLFRVEFDLTRAVAVPPAPWGHE